MSNRVAFVTGGSRGIGRAIALKLCRAGFEIVVASPEVENNELVAGEIRALNGEATTLDLDVTSPESVKEGFAKGVKDMQVSGEAIPEALASHRFSGKFMVRVPPEIHRRLAVEAAEAGVSLNRLASAKLS